jgi:uncharacterized membrane protein YgdD (TMEM256/DUF423 family)
MERSVQGQWAAAGAIWVALGIAVGAIGVHVLEARAMMEGAERWALAGRYAVTMGLGTVALVALRRSFMPGSSPWPERLLTLGLLGFSGGLIVKGLNPDAAVGAVIPYGGALLIAGWLWAAGQIFFHLTPRLR